MKSIVSLMVLQMLIGAWLFVSPFMLGYKELTGMAFNNMLLGAIVAILGLGVLLSKTFGVEAFWGSGHCLYPSCTLRRF